MLGQLVSSKSYLKFDGVNRCQPTTPYLALSRYGFPSADSLFSSIGGETAVPARK